ncbi:DUF6358 family protein [Mucilaginibacter sp. BT774]|uniref:DUF6358 family protein n=1 Tax=Mucilaginibacter sp. BT774 TaxID=3062276 RepID=UPI002674683F|nr:DUF6358 family protein [Mucilaginibacter sp. BT774]MDO3625847.1 DUF6358 family protein [Mucilaginibacter sp. BT774]
MGKKLALNVIYNLALVFCIIMIWTGIEKGRYEYILSALFIGAVFVILKIRLLKEVRNMQNKP